MRAPRLPWTARLRRTPGLRPGLVTPLLVGTFVGCSLDGFLFNHRATDAYQLPGNTISANLIEPVTLRSGDNTLYGFWVGSAGGRPGITAIYFHGNKHDIDQYWDRVMFLHDAGINVFVFDYRGFGRSEGTPTEAGLYADAEAALAYVLSRPGVSPDSIGLYGYSLGNVPSIYLAAERFDPLFLMAESPFAAANSLTQASLALNLPPGWLTDGRFDNVAEIRKIRAPLLLLHGEDDDFVRYRDNGRVVFENAPDPKQLKLVPGAVHDDVPQKMGLDVYRAAILQWIDQSIAPGP
ncbi:MAG: alpha/beta hydrolase [Gemmatimonadetes bacterium]|nr:alpha/beta hydrolase [Gemmatimonadota bacterium]